jgi:hypothetical protein
MHGGEDLMGMFDWVVCEVELPDGFSVAEDDYSNAFQTKDFDNIMATFKITEEGRLVVSGFGFDNEESTWHEYHLRDGRPFTGEFSFYTAEGGATPVGRWHEYVAKFEDGQLQEIVDDSERMERALQQDAR